mmetsp:Transcript_5982/g.20152  ORF Transcript_5982/g.20152 Transcript_5982/m.20152 type:complete len:93 (-) Transcript_5982:870-1148(-)
MGELVRGAERGVGDDGAREREGGRLGFCRARHRCARHPRARWRDVARACSAATFGSIGRSDTSRRRDSDTSRRRETSQEVKRACKMMHYNDI